MITYVVRMTAQPGKRDELLAGLRELVDGVTRDEPGALVYSFHTIDDDPDGLLSFEIFEDEAALEAHQRGQAVAAAGPKLAQLLAGSEFVRATPAMGKGVPLP